ncbi:phage baseplate protein [Xenorhabdus bovienii]|uniref:phage baseplate protein n=1 Tax=Xenorhabdus bovienii TaxID=40576 RepID=UPI003DA5DDB0
MITEVKIFNVNTFATLFESASPIQVSVRDEHKVTKFQVENGETRSDHIVVEAVEIGMELLLTGELKNSFAAMQQAYDTHQLVGIQTRVKTYQPMILANFYHDEVSEMADAIKLSLRFSEWRTIEPEYGELPPRKVAKKTQSGTVNRGNVQTRTATGRKKSVAVKIMDGDPLFGGK